MEHDLGNDTGIENASRENEPRSEEISALSEPTAPEQDEAPAEPVTEEPEAPVDVAPPSAETEPPAQPEPLTAQAKPVAADDVRVQVTPVAELTPPKPPSDYIAVEEVTGEESQPAGAAEPSEPYVEVPEERRPSELRGEEENSSVTLPPSVRERTAGGVEWEKPRRARPREPRRRGRRRRRPATTVQPRAKISELLHPGQEVIVQIIKEQIGTKGARITSHVTLPGRYLVYMPTIEHIGVSRRIRTEEERTRLRRILLQLKGSLSGGFVLRTAAEGAREDDIRRDLEYLVKLWRDIVQRADQTAAPVLLHRDLTLLERILRDQLTADFEALWIDSEEEYAKVVEFVSRFQPALVHRAKLYTKDEPIFEGMGIQQEIEHALRPKVWLKSGGYIVINHTEALVAIDVNTGKFVGRGSTRLEDTIVTTNLDAVREIVRQIRLRDLGGIIVIDFIDMEDRRNRQKVMQALEQELRRDRAPSKILAFNEFGLIAITRKRVRQSLEKVLCQPCPYCIGTGMVKSIPTLCYEIQAEARKMAQAVDAPELTIRAHPEVAKALKGREVGLVRELEEQTGKNIIVQPDQSLQFDQYNIF